MQLPGWSAWAYVGDSARREYRRVRVQPGDGMGRRGGCMPRDLL
jgi:hypothetical protein